LFNDQITLSNRKGETSMVQIPQKKMNRRSAKLIENQRS